MDRKFSLWNVRLLFGGSDVILVILVIKIEFRSIRKSP